MQQFRGEFRPDHLFRLQQTVRIGGFQKQLDEFRRGAIGHGQTRIGPDDRNRPLLHPRFRHPGNMKQPRVDPPVQHRFQDRQQLVVEHRMQFGRRTRQHNDPFGCGGRDIDSRCRTERIQQRFRAVRNVGLIQKIQRERTAFERIPARTDRFFRFRIQFQRHAKIIRNGLLGQIVRSRAESPGRDDEIGVPECIFQRVHHFTGFVGHLQTKFRHDADFQQALTHIGQIGVDDRAFQQFIPDAEHSDFHDFTFLSVCLWSAHSAVFPLPDTIPSTPLWKDSAAR